MSEAPLRPPAPRELEAGESLPGGWRVVSAGPLLHLEQRGADDLLRRAVVPLGPLLLAALAWGASRDAGFGVQLGAVSFAVLLLGVSALGALNFVRSVRRRRQGVRLQVEAERLTGYPEARAWLADYFASLQTHPRQSARAATLTVYRDPSRGAARARLRVELAEGGALVGPEASGEDAEWPAVRDALLPAGAALAKSLGVPLTLDYPWCKERFEL